MWFCVIAFFFIYILLCVKVKVSRAVYLFFEESFIVLIYFDYTKHGVSYYYHYYYYYYGPRKSQSVNREIVFI